MSVKPDAKQWAVQEQIVEDQTTGLTFQFEVMEGSDAPFRLRIFGKVPFGNREILFDKNGEEAGGGTLLAGLCRPAWLQKVED
jgi:hypothetical protein